MSLLAALASGLLLWACHPPAGMGALVWVALMPLLAVLWGGPNGPLLREGGPRAAWWRPTRAIGAFLHGYLAGATFFLLNLNWLHHVTALGMVMLALYLALYPALWALFAATIGRPRRDTRGELARGVIATAAAWTGLEWLRGTVFTGFGWNGLGVALADFARGSIAQWAEWIGVTGLSFFVVILTGLLVGRFRLAKARPSLTPFRRRLATARSGMVDIVVAGVVLILPGGWRAQSVGALSQDSPKLTVALIQPNIPQEHKNASESFEDIATTLARLTQQAFDTEPKPDLLVWPESSLPAPFYYEGVQDVLRQGNALGDFVHVLGIDDQEIDAYYNSVAVFRGDPLEAALYHKVHLVPFGEYLPARGLFGRFDFIREQLPGDFKPGDITVPLPLPPRSAARRETDSAAPSPLDTSPPFSLIPLVCFEDTIGRVARRFVREEPQLIVNVTNDAWFEDSAGADQHLANARFRAIELRRPMVRAANTGATAVIDELGRVTHRLPRLQAAQLKATVARPVHAKKTLYARIGDTFSVALLALAGLAAGHSWWTRRPPGRP